MSKSRLRKPRKALGAGRVRSAAKIDTLSASARAFVHVYDTNGNNGTKAYQEVHPGTKATTAATEAWKLLRNPEIAAMLTNLRRARWQRLAMDADEALALVSNDARADIRDLFGKGWTLLPPSKWPDNIARCVKGIRPGVAGTAVLLNDSLAARRLILELAGEVEGPAEVLGSTIARILAGHYKAPGEKPPEPTP
jgi:Terminase small subunit